MWCDPRSNARIALSHSTNLNRLMQNKRPRNYPRPFLVSLCKGKCAHANPSCHVGRIRDVALLSAPNSEPTRPRASMLAPKPVYATCVFGAYCFDVSPKNTSYQHRKQYTFQMRIILSLERPSCVLKSALRWSSSIFIR